MIKKCEVRGFIKREPNLDLQTLRCILLPSIVPFSWQFVVRRLGAGYLTWGALVFGLSCVERMLCLGVRSYYVR
jgi:hypothetical protein